MTEDSWKGKYVYITERKKGTGLYKFAKAKVIRDDGRNLWLSDLVSLWDGSKVNGATQIKKTTVDSGYYCSSTFEYALTALECIAGACQDEADAMHESVTRQVDAVFKATENAEDRDIDDILYPPKKKEEADESEQTKSD